LADAGGSSNIETLFTKGFYAPSAMRRNGNNRRLRRETRQDRANAITVEEIQRVRNGVFEVTFLNENGQQRSHTLIPREVYSTSPDMRYRGNEGHVGKYLRALAMANDDAREQLREGIDSRRREVSNELSEVRDRLGRLETAQNNLTQSEEDLF